MKKFAIFLSVGSVITFLYLSSISVKAANIVDTASQYDQLKTFVAALKAGDLDTTLRGKGPFTVFAPTEEAFAKLPAGTLENILLPKNKSKLVKLLTYHVVAVKVVSSDLAGRIVKPKTVEGKRLSVNGKDGGIRVNTATVTKADIEADNGVIHVVDEVLMLPVEHLKSCHKAHRHCHN